ncbi:OLC1v1021852C1 [Oldenlandia corymbosa var. corymbosa]|uniref:OLC1v1021852C1 n=1 Tax=Oldenlandia corymbosa var. corymbosa TaxID=529605 RepID=A0AAV1BWL5_OLDCO|nr:OLC1v1021852C1 [Oldenlandia corymbosa var. corymbosa]
MESVTTEEGEVTYGEVDDLSTIDFANPVQRRMNRAMTYTVAVKPLGREFPYCLLHKRLKDMWQPKGEIFPSDVIEGYHMFRLSNVEDYNHVLLNGPWSIKEHYITVLPWTPNFDPTGENLSAVPTWIRIPGLPLKYFHEALLKDITKPMGRFIKGDRNTITAERGRYARVAVELDLSKPLKGKLRIDGKTYNIEYEDLRQICFHCGKYGHVIQSCPTAPPPPPSHEEAHLLMQHQQTSHLGEWNYAQKKIRRPYTPAKKQTFIFGQSKFSPLLELESKSAHEGTGDVPDKTTTGTQNDKFPTNTTGQTHLAGNTYKPKSSPSTGKGKNHGPAPKASKRKSDAAPTDPTWSKKTSPATNQPNLENQHNNQVGQHQPGPSSGPKPQQRTS